MRIVFRRCNPALLPLFGVGDAMPNGQRPPLVPKKFQDFFTRRMFRHMHGVLNIDEKKTNYTVW
jgi:hypothetical protein